MTTLLVSRHKATLDWLLAEARRRGWEPVVAATHLPQDLPAGVMRVAGIYPVSLAAAWARAGIETWHVQLDLQEDERGQELDAEQLAQRQPVLRRIRVIELEDEEEQE